MTDLTKLWADWINPYFVDGNMSSDELSSTLMQVPGAREFATSALSVHQYSQLVVVEKGHVNRPGTVKVALGQEGGT